MIATHSTKINGKWYKAGEEISPTKPQNKVTEQPQYTKTEIMRMNKAELQELARNTGVEGADEMSGAELKEYLLSVFGL